MATITGTANNDTLNGTSNDVINGLAGDDLLTASSSGNSALYGNPGNDTLNGGSGTNSLFGGQGNDMLVGGSGNELLDGGVGSNTLDGGAGADTLQSTDGTATLTYANSPSAVNVNLITGTNTGGYAQGDTISTDINEIIGSAYNDVITGGNYAMTLQGGPGDDQLTAGSTSSTLQGGQGNDALKGGTGADLLDGGAGINTLEGGPGGDTLQSTDSGGNANGSIMISYASSSAAVNVNIASGSFSGGDAQGDSIGYNTPVVGVIGSANNDVIVGSSSAVTLQGGPGDDQLTAGNSNSTLQGGQGNDALKGGTGADLLDGGAGINTLEGGPGGDTLQSTDSSGNANGSIMISYASSSAAVNVNIASGSFSGGDAQGDSIGYNTPVVGVIGSANNDVIVGSSSAVTLQGGPGDDQLTAGNSNSTLQGGQGNDLLIGGTGADLLDGGVGINTLEGGPGGDTLQATDSGGTANGSIMISYASSSSAVNVNIASGSFSGGDAQGDSIGYNTPVVGVIGSAYADNITGSNSAMTIEGGLGNDALQGGSGPDSIHGGHDDDNINGGQGNDTLNGGIGYNSLTGAGGSDTFVITPNVNAKDIITDFNVLDPNEKIDIRAFQDINLFSDISFSTNPDGSVLVNLTGKQTLQLDGVTPESLTSKNFIANWSNNKEINIHTVGQLYDGIQANDGTIPDYVLEKVTNYQITDFDTSNPGNVDAYLPHNIIDLSRFQLDTLQITPNGASSDIALGIGAVLTVQNVTPDQLSPANFILGNFNNEFDAKQANLLADWGSTDQVLVTHVDGNQQITPLGDSVVYTTPATHITYNNTAIQTSHGITVYPVSNTPGTTQVVDGYDPTQRFNTIDVSALDIDSYSKIVTTTDGTNSYINIGGQNNIQVTNTQPSDLNNVIAPGVVNSQVADYMALAKLTHVQAKEFDTAQTGYVWPQDYNQINQYVQQEGWVKLFDSQAASINIDQNTFYGSVMANPATGQVVIAVRGSDNVNDWLVKDVLGIGTGDFPTAHFDAALAFGNWAQDQIENNPNYSQYANAFDNGQVVTTGHSLGGPGAQLIAQNLGIQSYVDDPVGAYNVFQEYDFTNVDASQHHIFLFGTNIVNSAQPQIGIVSMIPNPSSEIGGAISQDSQALFGFNMDLTSEIHSFDTAGTYVINNFGALGSALAPAISGANPTNYMDFFLIDNHSLMGPIDYLNSGGAIYTQNVVPSNIVEGVAYRFITDGQPEGTLGPVQNGLLTIAGPFIGTSGQNPTPTLLNQIPVVSTIFQIDDIAVSAVESMGKDLPATIIADLLLGKGLNKIAQSLAPALKNNIIQGIESSAITSIAPQAVSDYINAGAFGADGTLGEVFANAGYAVGLNLVGQALQGKLNLADSSALGQQAVIAATSVAATDIGTAISTDIMGSAEAAQIGSALGTIIEPGIGTIIGETIGETIGEVITLVAGAEITDKLIQPVLAVWHDITDVTNDIKQFLRNPGQALFGSSWTNFVGTNGPDIMRSDSDKQRVDLLAGNDVYFAYDAWEVAFGGPGNDILFGGNSPSRPNELYGDGDSDLLIGGINSSNNNLYGGPGSDTVIGGNGADNIYGKDRPNDYYGREQPTVPDSGNLMIGGLGQDVMVGDIADDTMYGGRHMDADPLDSADNMAGNGGNDLMYGHAGNDLMDGGDGHDTMYGGSDHDSMIGGTGNDNLYGNKGNNTLTGGTGNDKFFIDNNPGGTDIITDFEVTNLNEQIILSSIDQVTAISQLSLTQQGSDTTINLPNNQKVILKNINMGDLHARNFDHVTAQALDDGDSVSNSTSLLTDTAWPAGNNTLYYSFDSSKVNFHSSQLDNSLSNSTGTYRNVTEMVNQNMTSLANETQYNFNMQSALINNTINNSGNFTYSLPNVTDSTVISNDTQNVNTAQRIAFMNAMNAVSSITNQQFYPALNGSTPDITIAASTVVTNGTLGVAVNILDLNTHTIDHVDAYVQPAPETTNVSQTDNFIALHELEHAHGFGHSNNTNASIMSTTVPITNIPTGYLVDDIAAFQKLYGANTNYNSGNTTYYLDGSYQRQAIWDGGGNSDTVDTSAVTSNVKVDLREGSTYQTTAGNATVWMAHGSNIENANAGSGSDDLQGNALNNRLNGGPGNNTYNGNGGANRFVIANSAGDVETIRDFNVTSGDQIDLTSSLITNPCTLNVTYQTNQATINMPSNHSVVMENIAVGSLKPNHFIMAQNSTFINGTTSYNVTSGPSVICEPAQAISSSSSTALHSSSTHSSSTPSSIHPVTSSSTSSLSASSSGHSISSSMVSSSAHSSSTSSSSRLVSSSITSSSSHSSSVSLSSQPISSSAVSSSVHSSGASSSSDQASSSAITSSGANNSTSSFYNLLDSNSYYAQRASFINTMNGTSMVTASTYEAIVDKWQPDIPQSVERIACISLACDQNATNSLLTPSLANAIVNGERALAWQQIQYNSNLDNSNSTAARRSIQAGQFGLYKNSSQPTLNESINVGQMYAQNAVAIEAYETKYASGIASANHQYNTTKAQSIGDAQQPAINLFAELNNVTIAMPIQRLQVANSSTPVSTGGPLNDMIVSYAPGANLHGGDGIFNVLIAPSGDLYSSNSGEWMVGGAGRTVYHMNQNGQFCHNTISDGNNSTSEITYNSVAVKGVAQPTNSTTYMLTGSDGNKWLMSKVNSAGTPTINGADLKIMNATGDGSNSITVKNYQNNQLGITLNTTANTHSSSGANNGPGPDVIDMPGEVLVPPIQYESSIPSSTALPGSPQMSESSNMDATTAASVIGGVALATAIGAYAYKNRAAIRGVMSRGVIGWTIRRGISAVEGGIYLASSVSNMLGYGAKKYDNVQETDIEMGTSQAADHHTSPAVALSNVIPINTAISKPDIAITINQEAVSAAKIEFSKRFPPKQTRTISPIRPRSSSFTEAEKLRRMPKAVNEV